MEQELHVRTYFDRALLLPPEEREPFLLRECTDSTVREFVLRLLTAHDRETGFLMRRPVAEPPRRVTIGAGQRIGPYTIETEIGRGGMGVVYRAVRSDDTYRKTVAVKVVSFGISADLFRRERQIMASLEHANIARLLDGGATDDGSLYIVMEFVDGERIDKWARGRNLSTRERLRLLLSVCDAIAYAHRNLVVHSDLKPANILVTADCVPKLLDFGVARVLAGEPGTTQTGHVALTPDYASPEQIRGDKVTTATDVYSFGLVLFEVLTRGKRPYERANEPLRAVLESEPRRPSSLVQAKLRRELRGDLDKIVLKAIAKEPERRYASIQELRSDIEAWLSGRPVKAQGDRLLYRARKFMRRYWVPVGAAAAVLVSACTGTVAVLEQAAIAEQRRVAAEQATQRAEDLAGSRQRLLAEQVALRARAESEARRAQEQQSVAEQRLRNARDLAAELLFEIHDAVRDLSGATEARRRIVESAIRQLESLSQDAPEDSRLQRVLAAAYERAGDLVGGISGEGTDGTSAGLDFYNKSLAINQRLARDAVEMSDANTWFRLAHAWRRVGIVQYRRADFKAAAQSLREARRSLEAGRRRGALWPELDAEIHHHLCNYEVFAGERAAASTTCRAAIAKMRQFISTEFIAPEARHTRAVAFQRLARMTQQAGDVPAALELLNAAIQEQSRLVRENPDNAAYRRSLSVMLGYLARWRDQIGGANALAGYAMALESFRAARAADPRQTIIAMLHAWTAMRYSAALHRRGREGEARRAASESLAIFEDLIRAPGAGFMEFNDYANELSQCPYPDICDQQKALRYAKVAVDMTKGQNAFALDTLANVYFRTGAVEKAAETQRLALSFSGNLPAGAREEISTSLNRFEAELARRHELAEPGPATR
jgi:tetratricopeptide (TPR) repeat protein